VDAKVAKVYEKALMDRQYKTMFDLIEAQPSRDDMLRYGLEDDRNLLLFFKGLRDASSDFDRKKPAKGMLFIPSFAFFFSFLFPFSEFAFLTSRR
jgi:hypothetical protein